MERTTNGVTANSTEAVEQLHDQLRTSLAALVTSEDWQQALEVAAPVPQLLVLQQPVIWAQAQTRGFMPPMAPART